LRKHAPAGASKTGRFAAEERRAIVYVPVAVMWETSLLARVGRVELGRSVEEFFTDLFSNAAYQAFDLTPAQRL
jgi:PIN domain nuclease of toxin-antitoxin system